MTGETFFLVLPFSDTVCMNVFLDHLSETYREDYIILVCDGAAWHKSHELHKHDNIEFIFIPPGTPEMNPIEQIWKELRLRGFRNEIFQSLDQVVKRLCITMNNLTSDTVKSITGRNWILSCFN